MRLTLHALTYLSLLALLPLASTASAQMRPGCLDDPNKPGACFEELDGVFNGSIQCGVPSPANDSLNDGVFIWFGILGENDFFRTNPDGTIFVHQSDDNVGEAAYCTWQSIFDGSCGVVGAPERNVFVGSASIQVNGVVSGQGPASCPFVLTSSGELTRLGPDADPPTTITVKPRLHLVPAPHGGCRVTKCEINGQENDN